MVDQNLIDATRSLDAAIAQLIDDLASKNQFAVQFLTASGKAMWMSDAKDTYVGQGKFTIPLIEGIELPVSVTVANRTSLIKESEVRGLVGIAVDTTNLTALLGR